MAGAVAGFPGQAADAQRDEGVVLLSDAELHDVTDEGQAFIELQTDRDAYFVHEPIRLRLRFGFERAFLETSLIQLFQRRVDVPAQVQAPWLGGLPGARAVERRDEPAGTPGTGARASFALNERLADAVLNEKRRGDERSFTVLELEQTFLPTEPGTLELPAPVLRFAYATRFEDDLLRGRVAVDRRDAVVRGRGLTLTITPLPEEGRPPDFGGAVGRFSVRAEAEPRELELGASLKLALVVEGDGDLEGFAPPRLEELAGFRVGGMLEERSATRRTLTYDLTPLHTTVAEVPAIAFTAFDPGPPAGYRTVTTAPIPIAVRPRVEPAAAVSGATGDDGSQTSDGLSGLTTGVIVAALLVPFALALGLRAWLRARERSRADRERARIRAATAAYLAQVQAPRAETERALTEFLAAILRCPPSKVDPKDLSERLNTVGGPRLAAPAARAAALLEDLRAERFAGGSARPSRDAEARELVLELAATLQVGTAER